MSTAYYCLLLAIALCFGAAHADITTTNLATDGLSAANNSFVNVSSTLKFTPGNALWIDDIEPFTRPEVYNYVAIHTGLDLTDTYVIGVHEITTVKNHDIAGGTLVGGYAYFDQFLNMQTGVMTVTVVGTCGSFLVPFWSYGLLYVFNESHAAKYIPITSSGITISSPYDGTTNYGRLKLVNGCGYALDWAYLAGLQIAKPTYVMDGYCDDIPDYGVFDCAPVNPDEWKRKKAKRTAKGKADRLSRRLEAMRAQESRA